MNWAMASSILSPPTLTEREKTIPDREITATSVVQPPISTIILPVGSVIGNPAPMAAAIGSSMNRDNRGLIAYNSLVLNIDEGVGGPKINGKIVGKNAKEGIQHHKTPSNLCEKGLKQRENNRFGLPWQGNEKINEKCRLGIRQWLQLVGPFPMIAIAYFD